VSLRDSDAQTKKMTLEAELAAEAKSIFALASLLRAAPALNDAHCVMCWLRLKPAKVAPFLAGVDRRLWIHQQARQTDANGTQKPDFGERKNPRQCFQLELSFH